ncbi:MAG: hypothetical protein AAF404_14610, partial [Pseudomonadota bacterium]
MHIPKVAGVHTINYFAKSLRFPVSISENHQPSGLWRDRSVEELHQQINNTPCFLHSHTLAYGWSELTNSIPFTPRQSIIHTIEKFKNQGWFVFSYVRHPGDILCSYYHYLQDFREKGRDDVLAAHCQVEGLTIDEFVSMHCEKPLLPDYWEIFDYTASANKENYTYFYKTYFSHQYNPTSKPL